MGCVAIGVKRSFDLTGCGTVLGRREEGQGDQKNGQDEKDHSDRSAVSSCNGLLRYASMCLCKDPIEKGRGSKAEKQDDHETCKNRDGMKKSNKSKHENIHKDTGCKPKENRESGRPPEDNRDKPAPVESWNPVAYLPHDDDDSSKGYAQKDV